MASSAVVPPVLLALLLLLVLPSVSAADDADATHLHFFMHDIVSGSSPSSVQVIKGPGAAGSNTIGMSFGDTYVFDDPLTETSSSSTSTPLGRMQGVYMLASQSGAVLSVTANILLTSGDFNGSTLAVMGRDDTAADVRELSVVGGTGKFRMASGYLLWKTAAMNGADATVELDVYIGGSNSTAAAGGDATGGDGSAASGGGGSSKPSSKATMNAAGWVVAVAAAVVGSCWVW